MSEVLDGSEGSYLVRLLLLAIALSECVDGLILIHRCIPHLFAVYSQQYISQFLSSVELALQVSLVAGQHPIHDAVSNNHCLSALLAILFQPYLVNHEIAVESTYRQKNEVVVSLGL